MQKMVMKINITTIENERENGNMNIERHRKNMCMMNSEHKEENDDERLLLLVHSTF